MSLQLTAGRTADAAPTPEEVADLYAAATAGPPLSEPRAQADGYGELFRYVLTRADLAWAAARRDGALVGFAYGHDWRWERQPDPWSRTLSDRLGTAAALLEDSFAVYVLVVHPDEQRRGLGRRLLDELLATAGTQRAWLQTRDEETPARALYRAAGWRELGHGPDAPDGRPGLVLGLGIEPLGVPEV
jgi:ribosomal protein S18 acetylase RimI-like enzyme